MGGFGEEAHPGEGLGREGDLICTGEAPADPIMEWGDFIGAED